MRQRGEETKKKKKEGGADGGERYRYLHIVLSIQTVSDVCCNIL